MSSLEENPIVFREREREKDYFFRNLVILDTHSKPLRIERGIIASGSLANVNACFYILTMLNIAVPFQGRLEQERNTLTLQLKCLSAVM